MDATSSKTCALDLSQEFQFDADCLGAYVAKLLGALILLGAFALKVPQIVNIVMSQDVKGLSPSAFYTEVPLSTISIVYNILQDNPFTSYGETCVISVQNFVLVVLLWIFMKPSPTPSTVIGVLTLFLLVGMISFNLPKEYWYVLPLSVLPMLIYSRSAQIVSNFQQGTTGQLSLITALLQFLGGLARVFTTIQEVGWDLPLLSGFVVSSALSGTLIAQIVYYSYVSPPGKKDKKAKQQ